MDLRVVPKRAVVNSAAINMEVQVSTFQELHPEVGLLDHRVVLF